jgi:hypothetical protein
MSRPRRALFKLVLPGDIRKINAESNNSPTGGGARDIRFSHELFKPVVTKMFPTVTAARKTKRSSLNVRAGTLAYFEDDERHTMEIRYWPPTEARNREGRIAQVPRMPSLRAIHYPQGQGAVFYLFIQGEDGNLTAHFASERSLREAGRWDPWVAETMLTALREAPANVCARGWLDWASGARYMSIKPKKAS